MTPNKTQPFSHPVRVAARVAAKRPDCRPGYPSTADFALEMVVLRIRRRVLSHGGGCHRPAEKAVCPRQACSLASYMEYQPAPVKTVTGGTFRRDDSCSAAFCAGCNKPAGLSHKTCDSKRRKKVTIYFEACPVNCITRIRNVPRFGMPQRATGARLQPLGDLSRAYRSAGWSCT